MTDFAKRACRLQKLPDLFVYAFWIFTVGLVFSVSILASTVEAAPTSPCQLDTEVFEQVEPGVRLLGKPSPSASLGPVLGFQLIPDTDQIITVCSDGLKLWDSKQQKVLRRRKFEQPVSTVESIVLSHDQRKIAISTWSYANVDPNQPGVVLVIDRKLGQVARFVNDQEQPETDAAEGQVGQLNKVTAIAFSEDDSKLALSSGNSLLWCDIASGKFEATYDLGRGRGISQLIIQRDQFLGLGWQSVLIDRKQGEVSPLSETIKIPPRLIESCFDGATNRLFMLGANEIRIAELLENSNETIELEQRNHVQNGMALSGDGSLLAVASYQPRGKSGFQISVLDSKTGEVQHVLEGLTMRPQQLEFSLIMTH